MKNIGKYMATEKEIAKKADKFLSEAMDRISGLPFDYDDLEPFTKGLFLGFICGYKERDCEIQQESDEK